MKAPFPWFGGKSRVAPAIWDAFGNVTNYVEPFAGSLAVLFDRPHEPKVETVNDADGLLVNFWRAIRFAPDQVAAHADWPVSELDISARHMRLNAQRIELTARLEHDADYCDPKLAGWWVYGACSWIGGGWCAGGSTRKLPHLGGGGRGINAASAPRTRQLPKLGDAGCGINAASAPSFEDLAARLRRVRIACGDWKRVCGPSVLSFNGASDTGIFLDPPYSEGNMSYAAGSGAVDAEVSAWAREHGDAYKIALCGYEGHHDMPGWSVHAWKTKGGYASQSEENVNTRRERVWFSPRCETRQGKLF